MVPPDPLKLPEPFKNILRKDEAIRKNIWTEADDY